MVDPGSTLARRAPFTVARVVVIVRTTFFRRMARVAVGQPRSRGSIVP